MECFTWFVTFYLELMGNSNAMNKSQPDKLFLVVPPCNTDPEKQVAVAANTPIDEWVNRGRGVISRPRPLSPSLLATTETEYP